MKFTFSISVVFILSLFFLVGCGAANNVVTGNAGSSQIYEEEKDTDGDGLPNGVETILGLNPFLGDTDKDGASDSEDPEPNYPAIAHPGDRPTAGEVLEQYLQAMKDRDIDRILSFNVGDMNTKQGLKEDFLSKIDIWAAFGHRFEQKPVMILDDENWKEYGYTMMINGERFGDSITMFRDDSGKWLLSGL